MKIIRDKIDEIVVEYFLEFELVDRPTAGYSFPCDEDGVVDWSRRAAESRKHYDNCLSGEYNVTPGTVRIRERPISHCAVGLCECGREVYLYRFTNPCECGRDYNSSGSLLSPRDQWGEETGEHLYDILRIR